MTARRALSAALPAEEARDLLRRQAFSRGEDGGALEDVRELPDVPRPGLGGEERQGVRRELERRELETRGELTGEMAGDQRDVARPLAQRRQLDREDLQTVEEIGAELPRRDHRGEIPVRRRDQPDVGGRASCCRRRARSARRRGPAAPSPARRAAARRPRRAAASRGSRARTAPARRRSAPVKAPFSCPKSSASTSVSGIAAQLTATNGPSRRGDRACRARAKSSLPVPLSPVSSTVLSVGATRSRARIAARSSGCEPTIGGAPGGAKIGGAAALRRPAPRRARRGARGRPASRGSRRRRASSPRPRPRPSRNR